MTTLPPATARTEPAASGGGGHRFGGSFLVGPAYPVVLFLGMAAVLFLVVWQTDARFGPGPETPGGPPIAGVSHVLRSWLYYDAGWYVSIVEDGYFFRLGEQSSVAFFPAYPLAVTAVAALVGNIAISAIVTTFFSGLAVAVMFRRWCADRMSSRATRTAVALLLLYPYAWYLYGTGYGDALFLAATLGAFLLLERGHPLAAGVVGAIATACRPTGLAVVVGLVAVGLDRRGVLTRDRGGPEGDERLRSRWRAVGATTSLREAMRFERQRWHLDRSRFRWVDGGLLLSVTGLAAFCAYLWLRFDDPIAFITAESAPGWNQGAGPTTWFKRNFFAVVIRGDRDYALRLLAQAAITLGAFALVPRVAKRFGWGYGLYVMVVIGIPAVGSSTFQGLGRYSLAAFPCFAVAGEWLTERPRFRIPTLALSATTLATLTMLFARGYYLS